LIAYANEGKFGSFKEGNVRKYVFWLEIDGKNYDTLREILRILENVDDFLVSIRLEVDRHAKL